MPHPANRSKPIEAKMPFQELTSLLSHLTLCSQVAEHGLGNLQTEADESRVGPTLIPYSGDQQRFSERASVALPVPAAAIENQRPLLTGPTPVPRPCATSLAPRGFATCIALSPYNPPALTIQLGFLEDGTVLPER